MISRCKCSSYDLRGLEGTVRALFSLNLYVEKQFVLETRLFFYLQTTCLHAYLNKLKTVSGLQWVWNFIEGNPITH